MKAAIVRKPGGPEVLGIEDVAVPQRVLPDYVSSTDVKNIPSPYIDLWTEGYPPDQVGQQTTVAHVGTRSRARR